MTMDQHQCVGRASRLLLYAIKWLERATAEEMPEKELKRLLRAKELVEKAKNKL